ncbi:chloride channel protein [Lichenihabitans sp. Uapishka_5]|uniref:chloride channel protein n=1 Tax=Lichenihabitans sp. Uapishka_5 TaxID=3037302 RepID=UPI0029E80026|nr:chloride channel protein [Lichenihabitans sp. Uapishka_5]MDX7949954.1 chloride channel protein [Lichenihabitans sp. Uapishka_5]
MSSVRLHLSKATLPAALRRFVRSRASGLVLVAVLIGLVGGLLVVALSATVQFLHETLFGLARNQHLSAMPALTPWRGILVPCIGGGVLALLTATARPLAGRLADAIEANALYGGHLSMKGSLFVTMQTVLSSGCGGSVGLEAGYTQICAAVSSRVGIVLAARRADMRLLVACGGAAAIAGAFNAPLAGAFYGFEVVLGTYTVGALSPVAASALAACLVTRQFVDHPYLVPPGAIGAMHGGEIAHVAMISLVAALLGIGLMQAVGTCEGLFSRFRIDLRLRPIIGGLLIGLLSLATPQVLGAGHGALSIDLAVPLLPATLAALFLLKGLASAISLGSGFRGGLFYASLLLGALVGRCYAGVAAAWMPSLAPDPGLAALAGIAAFGTGVIGAPVTMTALTLEATGSFTVAIVSLIAASIASLVVRDLFGYSFATWRFHLRGEAIRGPHDVGWLRDLTVRKLMRADVRTAPSHWTVDEARAAFALGSLKNFALADAAGRYAGLVLLDDLYTTASEPDESILCLARHRDAVLLPGMAVRTALDLFEASEADVMIVVDRATDGTIVGVLSESSALRAYGRELERQSPDNVTTMQAKGATLH